MSMCRLVIIFGSTNAPTPIGLLAKKGNRCRDFLALGNFELLPILLLILSFNRKLDPSRKGK